MHTNVYDTNTVLYTVPYYGDQEYGPCIAFLLTFKYEDKDNAVLMHFSHSIIKKEKKNKFGLVGKLVEILQHITTERLC